ncbi:MAG: hypothetical protein K6G54_06885 [Oscillospiraceae bacterium]|nr:hypothetical protein [Oscillospiraceae bacterium]
MKKVLWVSRHEMTAAQKADLDRVMGGAELVPMRETVRDIAVLRPLLAGVDAVAAVLPPELLAELLSIADGKPVLRAVSGRDPTGRILTLQDGRREPEFAFIHVCWEQVLRIEICTRRL